MIIECSSGSVSADDIRPWTLWEDWTKGQDLKDEFREYLQDEYLWKISKQDRRKC